MTPEEIEESESHFQVSGTLESVIRDRDISLSDLQYSHLPTQALLMGPCCRQRLLIDFIVCIMIHV